METWYGLVKTPADAIKLFEACRQGLLPRVQRRLSEKERQQIRAGSVFVWDEREAGMRRWTDGKSWSASRVAGSFLTYREMEGKRGAGFGNGNGRKGSAKTPEARTSDEEQDEGEPDGYRYKTNGLMKQSFSITTNMGNHLHLISYSSRHQPGDPQLLTPSTDPALASIQPSKGMYPESSLGENPQGPAFTRTPMQAYPVPHHHPGHPQHHPHPQAHHYAHPQQHPQYTTTQNGYSWPPSPLPTPPYSGGHYQQHAVAAQYHQQQHQQQQQQQQQQAPPPQVHQMPPSYKPAPAAYERVSLPPLQQQPQQQPVYSRQAPQPLSRPQASPSPRYEDPSGSPSAYTLAMRATQAITSPHSSTSELGPSLPPITTMATSPRSIAAPASIKMESTPSPKAESPAMLDRPLSVSPPRSAHSDSLPTLAPLARSATSISSLLHHPTPSDAGSSGAAHIGSASSSPRTVLGAPVMSKRPQGISEDMRAVNVLNKNFRFSV